MDPDSLDATQLRLDDAVQNLSAYVAMQYGCDPKLQHHVDSIILAIEDLFEAEREDAHRELDFGDDTD